MDEPRVDTGGAGSPRHLALAALLLSLQGCAIPRGSEGDPFAERAAAEEIEILVRNLNFNQVTVYTARAGSGQRLGIVPGKGEATFRLRWTLPEIRLRVRPLAGREFHTETLSVAPGELLELIIPPRQGGTSCVYPTPSSVCSVPS